MWLANDRIAMTAVPSRGRRTIVIAIPARDESATITACLAAIDTAACAIDMPITILVSANNCSDATAARARAFVHRTAQVIVDEIRLRAPDAHAGGARRAAMDRAADIAGADGIVMTTDADSRVDPDWIAANMAELDAGADAVAGIITFDAAARAQLPALAARSDEWRLASLHARLEHLLDPRPHDPWPRHIWAWGASFAMTVAAYRSVGGVPRIPLAEDRALADALDTAGLRLRRSLAPLVYTSPRRNGRAPGGFADLIDSYARNPDTPCDAALEPTTTFIHRIVLRSILRRRDPAGFAARWPALEAATPRLARQRVSPANLVVEIAHAERAILTLERRAERRSGNRHTVAAE